MAELFDSSRIDIKSQPLAYRMRPRTLDEYIGQDHIVGPGRLLRRSIQADQLSSVIFYGPPGTGKTTLARVIANTTKSHFSTINAVLSGQEAKVLPSGQSDEQLLDIFATHLADLYFKYLSSAEVMIRTTPDPEMDQTAARVLGLV